jgi:hypothetical protein
MDFFPMSTLFRTKAVADIVADIEHDGSGLRRTLGTFDLVMLGIYAFYGVRHSRLRDRPT